MNGEVRLMRRELYRLRGDCDTAEKRDEKLRRERENARRRRARLTEQQREDILQ